MKYTELPKLKPRMHYVKYFFIGLLAMLLTPLALLTVPLIAIYIVGYSLFGD